MNTLEWKEFSSSSGEITQLKKKIQKNKIKLQLLYRRMKIPEERCNEVKE